MEDPRHFHSGQAVPAELASRDRLVAAQEKRR
jgi:hypothetical protein